MKMKHNNETTVKKNNKNSNTAYMIIKEYMDVYNAVPCWLQPAWYTHQYTLTGNV